jgi:prepilin-type N-terminal cleavage/methylation domain-containing protein
MRPSVSSTEEVRVSRSRGLSLLEVLVATTLLSVLLLGASELLLTGQNAYAMSTSQAMVSGEAQRAAGPPPGASRRRAGPSRASRARR